MGFTYTGNGVQEHHTYELPPPGDYSVRITECNEKISKSSGKNMLELVCEIEHPKYKGKLWDYIVDNEYAQQHIFDVLTSCGVAPKAGMQILPSTFVGKAARVRVKHETSNGETRLRLNYWCRPEKSTAPQQNNPAPAASNETAPDDVPF